MTLNKFSNPALNINLVGVILRMMLANFDHFLELNCSAAALLFTTFCSQRLPNFAVRDPYP
jgi:hypothetical protein